MLENTLINKIVTTEFKNKRLVRIIILILGLILGFFFTFKGPTDPDLSWHLKTGQLILEKLSIPKIDWYSHTMSNFAWVDHEWLSEILLYKGYQIFGFLGLAIAFSLIAISVFFFLIPRVAGKNTALEIKVLAGSLAVITSTFFLGIRPQVFTLLGLTLVLLVLTKLKENQNSKTLIFLPLIFLLWVNMHGGFAIGIGVLVLYLIVEGLKIRHLTSNIQHLTSNIQSKETQWVKKSETLTKKGWSRLSKFSIISVLVTLVNPYGPRIFIELKRTFTDSYGPQIIQEWLSPNFKGLCGILLAIYFIILVEIMILRKGKIDLGQFTFFILFLILALQSVRHVPLFVIVTLPYLIKSLGGKAQPQLDSKHLTGQGFFLSIFRTKSLLIMLVILVGFFGVKYRHLVLEPVKAGLSEEKLAEQGDYPFQALNWLKENPQEGNVFNNYGWGGYLILHLPETKTFIDGRMAHWRSASYQRFGSALDQRDKKHILKDYMEVTELNPNWQEIFKKYNVKWILIKKESSLSQALELSPDWQEIYRDDLAIIYGTKINQ